MFGRQPKEDQSPDNMEIPDIMFPSESELAETAEDDTELSQISNRRELPVTKENPEMTPASNGNVFLIPYLVLLTEQRILFGPGEKLKKIM